MARLEEKVEYIGSEIGDLKATMKEFIASSDTRYASKSTEVFVDRLRGTGALVVGLVMMGLLALVLNHVIPDFHL